MFRYGKLRVCLFTWLVLLCTAVPAFARHDPPQDRFSVRRVLSDGRWGPNREWRDRISDREIVEVSVVARRTRGSRETVLILGTDRGGFQPREMQIDQQRFHTVTWRAERGTRGRTLALYARGGEVEVESVIVTYAGSREDGYSGRYDRGLSHEEYKALSRIADVLDQRSAAAFSALRDSYGRNRLPYEMKEIERFVRQADYFENELDRRKNDGDVWRGLSYEVLRSGARAKEAAKNLRFDRRAADAWRDVTQALYDLDRFVRSREGYGRPGNYGRIGTIGGF